MSWRDCELVVAVLADDEGTARRIVDSASLRALPDQEPELAEGVFVPRGKAPSLGEIARLARSWERLDRVYMRTTDRDDEARGLITEFLEHTCLALDWGDDHLFVGPDGLLIAWPGERWRAVAHRWDRTCDALDDPDFASFHEKARALGL